MTIRRSYNKETGEKTFLPSRMPVLINTKYTEYELDPDLRRIKKLSVDSSEDKNREEAFFIESIVLSFAEMTVAEIIGDGIRIRIKGENDEALRIIKEWNREINVKHETIEDLIHDTWFDALMHGRFFYRIVPDSKWYESVDVQRLDPKTIEIRDDDVYGWRKFIQHLDSYKHYKSKEQFYRHAGTEKDLYGTQLYYRTGPANKVTYGEYPINETRDNLDFEIHIPDEPDRILFREFFKQPPMATAIKYILYKHWILYFMRKYSQKYWAPFVIAKVGDPKTNNYPDDPHIMQKSMENVSNIIKNMTTYGYLTVPGDVTVESLETNTARSSEIYPMYIQEMDKQIMYSIFGSMGLRDASGNELSTQRGLREAYLKFIQGIRRKYELILTNFYALCLLPMNGIVGINPIDIDFEWSRLKFEDTKELMETIEIGYNIGLFKDLNEMRKAAQSIFSFLEELPGSEGNSLPDPPQPKQVESSLEKFYSEYVNNK